MSRLSPVEHMKVQIRGRRKRPGGRGPRVGFHRGNSPGRAVPEAVERTKYAPSIRPAVKEYERKQLLERVDREGATLGAAIPDRIEIQGEEVALQEFVFEIKRRDTVPAGERERVERAKRNLRRERRERLERIEDGTVSYEEGEALAEAVIGIDRALEALESLGPADLEREARAQEAADRKRWMRFLRQALGREDETTGRRGRP
jgi:hypothetical protein